MRDQGRLVEWFDEQGYGFIQPNDHQKDRVFLHIKDFARQGPRPIVGCALEYTVTVDERGRYRAQQAVYLKASQTKAAKASAVSAKTSNSHAKNAADANIMCGLYCCFGFADAVGIAQRHVVIIHQFDECAELLAVCTR